MKRDPESLLLTEDGEAYRRFVEWSVGDGFDLAIIKMTAPVDRNALIAWTKEQVPNACEIDLKTVGPNGARLWDLLLSARDQQRATMLMLHGLEESPSRLTILAQLNVERDELVKALALPWVLFVHPATYPALENKAPDFVDFAGLWLNEVPRRDDAGLVRASASLHGEDLAGESDLLHAVAAAIRRARIDQARDLLARYEFQYRAQPNDEPDAILARCLRAFVENHPEEALVLLREKLLPSFDRLSPESIKAMTYLIDILRLRGEWSDALVLARKYLLPAFDRMGDLRSHAVTLGKIASILATRGELDEALRIRREEQLPVYERLGDVRERAVTLGKVADILTARGELDEALRIRREEELPVYERLNDIRERAVTLGQIADILTKRGELDEALRIRREDELPVYERLGDVRARAVTLGKVADVLTTRGKLDEALQIYREEQLPVYERLGDVRSRAVTLGKVADILRIRGELDEALRVYREEELPVYERLGDVRTLLVARTNVALTLSRRGHPDDREEIEQLLALALQDARRLRIPEVQTIEGIIRRMGRDPLAPPFA